MTASVPPVQPSEGRPSDAPHWAQPVSKLKASDVPTGAININVEGREVVSPLQGFGSLWQKTYRVRLPGLQQTPAEVMQVWREHFPKFQPPESHFYPTMMGLRPGEVVFLDGVVPAFPGSPSIMPVATGMLVLYVDDTSFTLMTPEGHPESGWNTFSVYEEEGCPVAQVQSLARATDPVYEFYARYLGSSEQQEKIWTHVLTSLAAHFGLQGQVQASKTCLDSKVQWSQAKNIWQSAAVRTVFYKLAAPLRWAGKLLQRR